MAETLLSLCLDDQYTTMSFPNFDLFSIEQAALLFLDEQAKKEPAPQQRQRRTPPQQRITPNKGGRRTPSRNNEQHLAHGVNIDTGFQLYYLDAQTGSRRVLSKPSDVLGFQAHCLAYNRPLRLYISRNNSSAEDSKTTPTPDIRGNPSPKRQDPSSTRPVRRPVGKPPMMPLPIALGTQIKPTPVSPPPAIDASSTAVSSLSSTGVENDDTAPNELNASAHSEPVATTADSSGSAADVESVAATVESNIPSVSTATNNSLPVAASVTPMAAAVPANATGNSLSVNEAAAPTLRRHSSRPTMGRWKKEKLLGAGADGKVYLAVDTKTGSQFAVKELLISSDNEGKKGDAQANKEEVRNDVIRKQMEILQSLPHHENVVTHTGVERTTCALNIMMEYVKGGSISSLVSRLGQFGEGVIRTYTKHICTALAFLHQHSVIHRDVKGANILIGLNNVAKLTDFGCCIINNAGIHRGLDGLHGTSMWMSPEAITQHSTVDEKTDIWSLGCTVIEMATGKPPWHEAHFTNEWAGMFFISQSGRGPPIPPHLSRQAHRFLQKCFAIDPADRPSAAECLEDPFLMETFVAASNNPDLCPPSPSELAPPHSFPDQDRREGSPEESYATSTLSSISFAVYDAEWGNTSTNMDAVFNDPSAERAGPFLPSIDQPLNRRASLLQAQQQRGASNTVTPEVSSARVASITPTTVVSQEAIAGFLLETENQRAAFSIANWDTVDDGYGFGLPEPILFNIFHFLDAQGLCYVSAVSRGLQSLVDHGAKEVLWRKLFLANFGDMDNVRLGMRKNWKVYYRDSLKFHSALVGERYIFLRRLAESTNVFEGIDTQTDEKVMIKVEAIPPGSRRHQASATFNQTMTSPMKATGSSSNLMSVDSPSANVASQRTPTKTRVGSGLTPTKANAVPPLEHPPAPIVSKLQTESRAPLPLPPRGTSGGLSISGTSAGNTSTGSVTSPTRPPTSNSPTPSSPQVLPAVQLSTAPLRGRVLPRTRGHQRPLVPSSPGTRRAPSSGSTRTTSRLGTAGGVEGESLTTRTGSGNWSDLYEYQRVETAQPATKPHRSMLLQAYKVGRHLEAMGVGCVPRVLHYSDTDVDAYHVLVTSALGPSLNELLRFCGNQLSLRTVMQLTLRILRSLQSLHEQGAVHGAISPSNIVMGTGGSMADTFLINFAHSRFFKDPKTHRPTTTTSSLSVGNKPKNQELVSFASTFVQRGCTPAPRDDIISLGYVLCYLVHGGLPWIKDDKLNPDQVVVAKNQYLETIAKQPPIQLHYFLRTAYAMKQGELPDVPYLCNLIQRLMVDRGWKDEGDYDWTGRAVF